MMIAFFKPNLSINFDIFSTRGHFTLPWHEVKKSKHFDALFSVNEPFSKRKSSF